MESSSEDNFLWSEASSASCDDLKAVDNSNRKYSDKSENSNLYENKNTNSEQESTSSHNMEENILEVKVKKEKSKNDLKKNKKIEENILEVKVEKEKSKNDYKKNKKIEENILEVKVEKEKSKNDTKKMEENILEVKVEKEKSKNNSKKNKKIKVEPESDLDIPKKKKKDKHKNLSDDIHSKCKHNGGHSDIVGDDKFKVEEIGYHMQEHQTDADKSTTQIMSQNGSGALPHNKFHEITDESSGDEISAIKGDDTHSLQTTLFANANETMLSEKSQKKSRGSYSDESIVDKNDFKQTEHINQKMLDRLRFEDDDQPANRKWSSKMKRYLKENSESKQVTACLDSSNIITSDDEIWLLRGPKELDIEAFEGIYLKQDGKCKVKINGQSYEAFGKEEENNLVSVMSVVDAKYQISNFSLPVSINLRQRIPKCHVHENSTIINNQTNFIPLPETKSRHPLFGSNYKKALKIPNAIAERLCINDTNNEQHSGLYERRKKKMGEITAKKKRKLNSDGTSPKKKRIKHDPESVEAWDSEKAIEENLFNF